ncbi:uncharacterized protein LOC127594818 [Hippocampus zosterae]|uniref:uncharacterized protein LOC127594818 n=1 Tax=Hippocampus zosterae TaxID=109293 RepID=UPI00223E30AE|nr:uncharacterized protein LOC127594818 [Hippocampus zosterae]
MTVWDKTSFNECNSTFWMYEYQPHMKHQEHNSSCVFNAMRALNRTFVFVKEHGMGTISAMREQVKLPLSKLLEGKNYLTLLKRSAGLSGSRRVIHYKADKEPSSETLDHEAQPAVRYIPKHPLRVLDAPGLKDDFYSNILAWSSKDLVAVSLGTEVYSWAHQQGRTETLFDNGPYINVSSLSFSEDGTTLYLGDETGFLHVIDVARKEKVRGVLRHQMRIGVTATHDRKVATASRDKAIKVEDERSGNGIRLETIWPRGGNDNQLLVWDMRRADHPACRFSHKAAVKAVAWSPHQSSVLASGGGCSDRCIKLWDISNSKLTDTIRTNSQICNLAFSKLENELVTCHGFSENVVGVWNLRQRQQIAALTGHLNRVLYMGVSPSG